jgi:hypothetical protein
MNTEEKNPGYLVETKTGKKGRTYHREGLVNKKTVVHVEDEDGKITKFLCESKSLKIIGYFD